MQARHAQLFKQIEKDMDKTDELKQIPNLVEAIVPYYSLAFIKSTLKLTFNSERSKDEFYNSIKNKPEVYNLVVFGRSEDRAAVEVSVLLDEANKGKSYYHIIQLLQKLFPAKSSELDEKKSVALRGSI